MSILRFIFKLVICCGQPICRLAEDFDPGLKKDKKCFEGKIK